LKYKEVYLNTWASVWFEMCWGHCRIRKGIFKSAGTRHRQDLRSKHQKLIYNLNYIINYKLIHFSIFLEGWTTSNFTTCHVIKKNQIIFIFSKYTLVMLIFNQMEWNWIIFWVFQSNLTS